MEELHRRTPADIAELLCHLTMQASEHAVILLRLDGTVLWCNPGAEHLFATSLDEIVGKNFHQIFTSPDQAAGIDRLELEIAKAEAIAEDDRWHVRADGSTFWSAGALVPIRDPASGRLLGFGKIIRDRTDVKTQLALLSNQIERLKAMDRHRERAIATFSHELRNVAAGLQGVADLLDRPLDNHEVRTRFAEIMRRQLGMLEHLTNDLLDVKRAEGGKMSLHLEPLVLQVELREMLAAAERRLMERRLRAQLLMPPADIVVDADRQRLRQIFDNILENAIKYTPPEGHIWVKLTVEDDFAVVHFEDTGRGIPHDMLQSIFELFTQVDSAHSAGGLGIGLALVRELVSLHGGSVQAMSKGVGQGSEISVRLPLRTVAVGAVV